MASSSNSDKLRRSPWAIKQLRQLKKQTMRIKLKTKKAIAYCEGSLCPQSLAKQDKHYVSCEKKKGGCARTAL
jgi:hypothetical protein